VDDNSIQLAVTMVKDGSSLDVEAHPAEAALQLV